MKKPSVSALLNEGFGSSPSQNLVLERRDKRETRFELATSTLAR